MISDGSKMAPPQQQQGEIQQSTLAGLQDRAKQSSMLHRSWEPWAAVASPAALSLHHNRQRKEYSDGRPHWQFLGIQPADAFDGPRQPD